MRVAIIGGGTIARLFLEHIKRGDLGDAEVVAIVGRSGNSRGKPLAAEFGVAFVTSLAELLKRQPDVAVEAASHEAVREYCGPLLDAGVAVIVLSCGALCDDALRARLEAGAAKSGALLDGPAREGVPHFPANVNIAAVLAMAGIGFDRTRLKVVADPALEYNTHFITIKGRTGNIRIKLENVPAPENPKTAWLACYSALAALKQMTSRTRYGT